MLWQWLTTRRTGFDPVTSTHAHKHTKTLMHNRTAGIVHRRFLSVFKSASRSDSHIALIKQILPLRDIFRQERPVIIDKA